jgi:hypothetical protein
MLQVVFDGKITYKMVEVSLCSNIPVPPAHWGISSPEVECLGFVHHFFLMS